MFKCTYCERELKSNAGKVRHENSCKARDIGGQLEEDVESPETELFIDDVNPTIIVEELDSCGNPRGVNVVKLEVLGGESTYYDGHPRRLIKLKGLLTRTYDRNERAKIYNMILELS